MTSTLADARMRFLGHGSDCERDRTVGSPGGQAAPRAVRQSLAGILVGCSAIAHREEAISQLQY